MEMSPLKQFIADQMSFSYILLPFNIHNSLLVIQCAATARNIQLEQERRLTIK